jgi:pantetheine-phosphate adenylyltransferase
MSERPAVRAVYPGTFDPIHNGHIDIATRAAGLFEHVTVAIYARPLKDLLFSTQERKLMIEQALGRIPNISVTTYNQLTVDFALQVGAQVIVRGLRVISDF